MVSYKAEDIDNVLQMLNEMEMKGFHNIVLMSAIFQILSNNQVHDNGGATCNTKTTQTQSSTTTDEMNRAKNEPNR